MFSDLNPSETKLIRMRWANILFTRFLKNIIKTLFRDSFFLSKTLCIETWENEIFREFDLICKEFDKN